MTDEAFDTLSMLKDLMTDRNTENARLSYNLASLIDAAASYAGNVGHRRGCRFDKCDCGYALLSEVLDMVRR